MTLVSRDHYETAYTVLCHFLLIVQRAPVLFSQVGHLASAAGGWQPLRGAWLVPCSARPVLLQHQCCLHPLPAACISGSHPQPAVLAPTL